MTKMSDFTLEELMLFIVGILGACGGFMLTLQKSKCESFCWGCMKRNVDAVIAEEKLQMTGHTGTTPQPHLIKENKTLKLELAEPEQEN